MSTKYVVTQSSCGIVDAVTIHDDYDSAEDNAKSLVLKFGRDVDYDVQIFSCDDTSSEPLLSNGEIEAWLDESEDNLLDA